MKYFIIALLLPILNFANDNPNFHYAKSYAQNRFDKFHWIKDLHLEACPELNNPNYLYDANYQYGYIIGSQNAYLDMINVMDQFD